MFALVVMVVAKVIRMAMVVQLFWSVRESLGNRTRAADKLDKTVKSGELPSFSALPDPYEGVLFYLPAALLYSWEEKKPGVWLPIR